MKRTLITITALLVSLSVFAGEINYIPMAVKKTDWQNPTVKNQIKAGLATMKGYPPSAAGEAKTLSEFKVTLVTNVVGNVALGITAGADYYISANSIKNWFGDDTAQAENKLDEAKALGIAQWILGDITTDTGLWFDYWGTVSQEVEPE